MRFAFILVSIGLVIGLLFSITRSSTPENSLRLTVGSASLSVEVATTSAARTKGLSGRPGLVGEEGLLFVFAHDGRYSFWMKDMRFSIDILWVASGGRIVEVTSNVSPETYPRSFTSREPVHFVIEVPAGFAASHSIVAGAFVRGIPRGLAAE